VWWDRTIPPGKTFDQVIEAALEVARCVVVVWSSASIASHWVRTEAEEGRQRNVLVPVLIDQEIRIPLAFRLIQAARLVDWQDAGPHLEFDRLIQALTDLIGPPASVRSAAPSVDTLTEPVRTPQTVANSLGMEFTLIPAGEFLMGSSNGDDDERPVHTVRISQSFYLGKYAVTQGQWEVVMGTNPSQFKGDLNRPVEQVSWGRTPKILSGSSMPNREEGSIVCRQKRSGSMQPALARQRPTVLGTT
jgi:hypothetical protein